MSDELDAGNGGMALDNSAPPPEGAVSDSEGSVKSTGTLAGGNASDKPVSAPANWPEDWRAKLAGEDKSYLKTLDRFNSPADLAKAYRDAQQRLSTFDAQRLVLPPIMDPLYGYQTVNVEAQSHDPHSLLNWTRRMLAVRKQQKAFGRGSLRTLTPSNRRILAYIREYTDADGNPEVILCVANVSRAAQAAELLHEMAQQDLALVGVPPQIKALQGLSRARQANVLRHWLRLAHHTTPAAAQLGELLDQILACTTRGHQIHIKVGRGFVERSGSGLDWSSPLNRL